MKKISILYWAQLTPDNNSFFPVVFFYPDLSFLSYVKQYGWNVNIRISDTKDLYNGIYYAQIDEATGLGGCPLDLSAQKIIYSASLPIPFTIYPSAPYLGSIEIINPLEQVSSTIKKENYEEPPTQKKEEFPEEDAIKENFELLPQKRKLEIVYEQPEQPKPCTKNANLTYVFIIIFFLILIILLCLCFYGELRTK